MIFLKIILAVEKTFLNIVQNSKVIKKSDKSNYLSKRSASFFKKYKQHQIKPGINMFKVYFRQKTNFLHMQRTSQINETSNPIEKTGREYEQDWA